MKLNKRIKSSLIQTFLFNLILLVVIVLFLIFSVWPSFQSIEDKKTNLASNYNELIAVEKQGISLKDFQSFSKKSNTDEYLKEVIKNTDTDFYQRNFNNETENNFSTFIEKKEQSVTEEKKAALLEERDETINKLLPVYVNDASEDGITDFEFINYVESLLYSFNLISQDSIGVGELKRVEEADSQGKSNLDSNMFYIPLKLELTGQKSDIIDFIHYLENVGSIDLGEQGVEVYSDEAISKNIIGDAKGEEYNLYKNQFSDIESISMDDYIDASSDVSKGTFTDFIKTTQKRQRFSIETEVRFYVQGLPDYKIENYITSVINMHSELSKESKKLLGRTFEGNGPDSSSTIKAKNSIRSISNILALMEEDIKDLRASLSKNDKDLENLYNDAEVYQERLSKIQEVIEDSSIALDSKK